VLRGGCWSALGLLLLLGGCEASTSQVLEQDSKQVPQGSDSIESEDCTKLKADIGALNGGSPCDAENFNKDYAAANLEGCDLRKLRIECIVFNGANFAEAILGLKPPEEGCNDVQKEAATVQGSSFLGASFI